MAFSDIQVRALNRPVPARNVKTRVSDGKELSYIEGWYCLSQANRIFGFDGWDRETIDTKCLLVREARGTWAAVYSARVRITVRTASGTVIRDGHGTGEAHAGSAGDTHDRALKAAETDATKRALATFGRAFGLSLYASQRDKAAKVAATSTTAEATPIAPAGVDSVAPPPASTIPAATSPPRPIAQVGISAGAKPPSASLGARGAFLPRARIDKSALAFPEPHRVRDKDHLRFVASQPCVLCSATPADAHHLRFAQPRAMARKVGDEFTVPLCRAHHRELHHGGNEVAWWHDMGLDPLEIARGLWEETQGRLARLNGTVAPSVPSVPYS